MVYLLNIVIFHGYVSHNQRVTIVGLSFGYPSPQTPSQRRGKVEIPSQKQGHHLLQPTSQQVTSSSGRVHWVFPVEAFMKYLTPKDIASSTASTKEGFTNKNWMKLELNGIDGIDNGNMTLACVWKWGLSRGIPPIDGHFNSENADEPLDSTHRQTTTKHQLAPAWRDLSSSWARISGSIFTIFPSLMCRPPDMRTSVSCCARRCNGAGTIPQGQSHCHGGLTSLWVLWFPCFLTKSPRLLPCLLVRSQLLLLKYSLLLFKALFNYPILLQNAQKMSIQDPKMTIETRTMMITRPNWWGIPHFQTTQFWWLNTPICHFVCWIYLYIIYIYYIILYIYIHHHIPWYPILPVYFMYTCMCIYICI